VLKKCRPILFLVCLLAYTRLSVSQNIENQPIASQYGVFRVPGQQLGSFNFNPDSCQESAGNRNFAAFSTGTPVKIVDSNPALIETVIPSSVYINNSQCVINVANVYTHAPPFYLTSGTGGLQEALINSMNISGANTIVLDTLWHQLVGSSAAAIIGAAKGNSTIGLADVTTTPYTWYSWSGSAYTAIPRGGNIPATGLVLKGAGTAGNSVPAVPGTDYVIPSGTVANATNAANGITSVSSIPSTCVAGSQYQLTVPPYGVYPCGQAAIPARNPGVGQITLYLSDYLANPSVPTQVRWDCSWSVSSSPSTITCPSGTFTPAMTGWVSWATQLDPRGDAEQANNFACGGQGTNPVLTYVSSTTVTINTACSVASSGGSGVGGYAFVFGPDETSAVDTWILAVANNCGVGLLPAGIVLTKHGGGGWNLTSAQNTNCANALADHSFAPVVKGVAQSRSTIGIEPAFDFTTCTGGPTSNACFGSAKSSTALNGGYSFSDFSINGFGSTLDASALTLWVEMLNGNYANNFSITKLGGATVANTVGIKMSGSFGQFWNLISDWAAATPCWVASGGTYSPNTIHGSSECVGGSGEPAVGTGLGAYGLLVTAGGGINSYGSIWAGGTTSVIASDVTIANGGSYTGYGDNVCCTNNGAVMGIIGIVNGGNVTLDGLNGSITNMGVGSHFIETAAGGSPTISLRNVNVAIGGGSGQQCYNIASGKFTDGGNNSCTGASLASVFPSWTYTGPINVAECTGCPSASVSSTWPPSASAPTFSPVSGTVSSGTTVTTSCSGGTPYISAGSTAVAGATGIAVSGSQTLYGSCQGSGYTTTGSAAYTVSGGGTTTYVNTTFNEAGAATNLAGTTPATCAAGCVGPWAFNGSGTDFTYSGSNSITTSTPNVSYVYDYIDAGAYNVVVRFNLATCAGVCEFLFRDSGGGDYIALNCTSASGGSCQMYDGPSFGTIGSALTGTVTGAYTVTLTGTSVTLAGPNGSTSGTTTNTSGIDYGFDLNLSGSAMSLTSYSVKSN
jgi:hypothetical protein